MGLSTSPNYLQFSIHIPYLLGVSGGDDAAVVDDGGGGGSGGSGHRGSSRSRGSGSRGGTPTRAKHLGVGLQGGHLCGRTDREGASGEGKGQGGRRKEGAGRENVEAEGNGHESGICTMIGRTSASFLAMRATGAPTGADSPSRVTTAAKMPDVKASADMSAYIRKGAREG